MRNPVCEEPYSSTNIPSIFDENIIYSITDVKGIITNVSNAFCRETGYDKDYAIGRTHSFLRAPGFPDDIYAQLWETISENRTWTGQIRNIRKSGEPYWTHSIIHPIFDDNRLKIGYLSLRQNITKEKNCEALSLIDELTGAYNRRKFNIELNNFLINYYRYHDNFSLIMIDVDYFKKFNDTYGHLIGDEVLKQVCNLVKGNIRSGDFFSRWGGEEFMLVFEKTDKYTAAKACQKLLDKIRLELPQFLFKNFGIQATLSCSMGITSPMNSDSLESLLARADSVLYRAKDNGRDTIEVF